MKIISSESFTKISPLINSESYNSLHVRLKMKLTPDEIELFSTPDFPVANRGNWQTDVDAPLNVYRDASAVEKEEIATAIEEKKHAILPKLGNAPYANLLFRVPDESQIFWYRNADGQVRVILSQWGFGPVAGGRDVDIVDIILNLPRPLTQMPVKIIVGYSDGEPAANQTFNLEVFNNVKAITTNDEGSYSLGKMFAGKKFAVSDANGMRYDFVVEAGKTDYCIVFDLKTDYEVTVFNQFNEVVSGYPLTCDGETFTTDADGKVKVTDVLLTKGKTVVVSGPNGSPQTYSLVRDAERNCFEYRMMVEVKTDYTIKVVDQNGLVKPEYSINVDGSPMVTNTAGMVEVRDLSWVNGMNITVSSAEGATETFSVDKDAANNNFVYKIEVLPPVEKKVRVKVLDYDGTILPGIEVFINTKKHGKVSAFTDQEGWATFKAELFENGEKAKVEFKVTKEYREKLEADKKKK